MTEMTQSLLASWQYMFSAYDPETAEESFLRTLNRVPAEVTPAMRGGLAFEKDVYAIASGKPTELHGDWERGANEIARIIYKAPTQLKLSRQSVIDGIPIICVGILDALKAGIIYDVKFSSKSLGSIEAAGKYFESPQHPMYFFLCPDAYEFEYLLSDGDDVYIEKYMARETMPIDYTIHEFFQYLKGAGLMEVYEEKWKVK